uniref:Cadherin domain-containing protein n=1 Tax=Hucho hucho TaxID=62062 RepID=A0A4W5NBJ2_9TELE
MSILIVRPPNPSCPSFPPGGNYDSRFDVGKASGTLIVARPLDAEQKSNYNLTVEATDGTRFVSAQARRASYSPSPSHSHSMGSP